MRVDLRVDSGGLRGICQGCLRGLWRRAPHVLHCVAFDEYRIFSFDHEDEIFSVIFE